MKCLVFLVREIVVLVADGATWQWSNAKPNKYRSWGPVNHWQSCSCSNKKHSNCWNSFKWRPTICIKSYGIRGWAVRICFSCWGHFHFHRCVDDFESSASQINSITDKFEIFRTIPQLILGISLYSMYSLIFQVYSKHMLDDPFEPAISDVHVPRCAKMCQENPINRSCLPRTGPVARLEAATSPGNQHHIRLRRLGSSDSDSVWIWQMIRKLRKRLGFKLLALRCLRHSKISLIWGGSQWPDLLST